MTGSEGSWTVRLGGPEYLLGQCGFPRYNVRSVRTVLNEASEGGVMCVYTLSNEGFLCLCIGERSLFVK